MRRWTLAAGAAALAIAGLEPATAETPGPRAGDVSALYHQSEAQRLVPLLLEVLRFPTVAGNAQAQAAQKAWLQRTAGELGLVFRDAGGVAEVELAGPEGAPVLGLVVHGDVQPVDEAEWSVPPFAGVLKDGSVWGRGAADDKGPLVQALLAMSALARSGVPRTQTVRLLVGSDEESTNTDIRGYLTTYKPPDLSLVLDSNFPVVVGEKAWNALTLTVEDPYATRDRGPAGRDAGPALTHLEAGLAASIVPSHATATLRWEPASAAGRPQAMAALLAEARRRGKAEGFGVALSESPDAVLTITGKAAHAGVNLEGGRNALVFLARLLHERLVPSGAADLLEFAAEAGRDLYGTGLGLTDSDPLWGRYAVNVATVKPGDGGTLVLTLNLRRIPPRTGPQLREHLQQRVAAFAARRGAKIASGGFYDDEPLAFDPESRIAKRLLASYERATGVHERPAISGGGTYAKRLPNAIAFGMWFPGKPYPGHDADEHVSVEDLQRGADVLIEALVDLATSAPMADPFGR